VDQNFKKGQRKSTPLKKVEEISFRESESKRNDSIRGERVKKIIVLTSRVHPGESNSSFLMHGVLEFLLSEDPKAQDLRENFIFKVIPMLNPDGVIIGNYRSSFLGVDLNRRWKNPSKYLHPTIYYAKYLIKWLHKYSDASLDNRVLLACDFHGHSRKKNVFMYGCIANPNDKDASQLNQVIQCVPESVCQTCSIFNFKDCKFACEKEKETTARIVLFRELGILNSYTLECTFYGSDLFKNPERRLKNLHSNL